MDRSWEPSAGEQSSFPLVQDDHSAEDSSEVALAWNSSLADSAAILEVFTTSFAVSDHSERMAGAGERHGGEVCMAERLAQAEDIGNLRTIFHLKECAHLRDRMGLLLAFLWRTMRSPSAWWH